MQDGSERSWVLLIHSITFKSQMSPVDKLVVRICFEFNVDLNNKLARTHQILKRFRHIPISLDDYDYIHHTTPWLVGAFFVHLHIILYNILP